MGYRLRLLGRLALEAGSEPSDGPAARPRSLALLAILASAGESGVPRDKLLLLLWPESNTQRARNSLHQALHTVRRHLGEDAIQAGPQTVRLNPAALTSDLQDFLGALDRSDVERAVELYGGAFLEGFHLSELPEFARWMEEERSRLRHLYSDALEAAAARASREGRHREAIERWQLVARLDPLSSRPALGLMRAFANAGNHAGALAHARDYEARVQEELGTAPDQAVSTLAEELRRSESDAGVVPRSSIDAAPAPPPRGAPARIWKAAVIGLVLMDLLALTALWLSRRHPPHRPVDPDLLPSSPSRSKGDRIAVPRQRHGGPADE